MRGNLEKHNEVILEIIIFGENCKEKMRKLTGVLLLLSTFGALQANALEQVDKNAVESSAVKEGQQSVDIAKRDFDNACRRLKQYYKDEIVSSTFEKYQNDINLFPKSAERLAAEHCPLWFIAYRKALDEARNGKWEQSRAELAKAKKPTPWTDIFPPYGAGEPVLADVLLLSAIVNKASSHYDEALADLKALYVLHKQSSEPWNSGSEFFAN